VLYIELLGRVRVSTGTERRPLKLTRQCATELADEAVNRGRANLSSAIWRLQRALRSGAAPPLSIGSMGDIGFDLDAPIWLDSESFEQALTPAFASPGVPLDEPVFSGVQQALQLYRGDYMPGWYDDWILAQRERLHALRFRGKLRLLEHFEASGAFDTAIACGLELLQMDALRETVHRSLMRIYARNGEPAKVVAQYRMLKDLLEKELGVRPSAQTQALYRSLMNPVSIAEPGDSLPPAT
jgi:DNA-binding SARP family transcriptional activator